MSKDYGTCVGCNTALTWVKNLTGVDENIKGRVLSRMAYEFDKSMGVKPRLNKGIYGKAYDTWSCGNCGYGGLKHGIEANWKYCPCCGFQINREAWQEKKREEFEQITMFEWMEGADGMDRTERQDAAGGA